VLLLGPPGGGGGNNFFLILLSISGSCDGTFVSVSYVLLAVATFFSI
jgi:hypothetical protein